MKNIPEIKLGIVAVSRDCFPKELSRKRKLKVLEECLNRDIPITDIKTLVENEKDSLKAIKEARQKNVNALVIFLGNFGPEGPTTLLAQRFEGPVMFAAAAEEAGKDLVEGRGDAFCGMLNTSYNAGLRHLLPYIPEYPVGTAAEIAEMIHDFLPVARIIGGIKKLKIFTFGPRPQDFLACNAPIKPLYDIGVEIMENSELDLYDAFKAAENDSGIKAVTQDMAKELGKGNTYPGLLDKLAQYEVALVKWMEENLGASEYGIFANKCWPAFENYFGFVPCYINSRLASRGIPVACNNTVPADMFKEAKNKTGDYKLSDLFMGFHCGNTPSCCLKDPSMKYQLIMNRLLESGKKPDITRGTLEGQIKPGKITLFRLQSTAGANLCAYAAEGEVLDISPRSFGSIGVFAVKEMARFYRHVLIEKKFPHHTAIAFKHTGKSLFSALRMLGVNDISHNQPKAMLYQHENPFS